MASLVVLWLAAAPLTDPELVTAVASYRALDYRDAAARLEKVLLRPQLPDDTRIQALAYLGRSRAVLRERDAAEQAFFSLLRLAPTFTVESGESLLIQEAWSAARARATSATPPPVPEVTVTPAAVELGTPPDAATTPPMAVTAAPAESFWLARWPWIAAGVAVIGAGVVLAVWRPWRPALAPAGTVGTFEVP